MFLILSIANTINKLFKNTEECIMEKEFKKSNKYFSDEFYFNDDILMFKLKELGIASSKKINDFLRDREKESFICSSKKLKNTNTKMVVGKAHFFEDDILDFIVLNEKKILKVYNSSLL